MHKYIALLSFMLTALVSPGCGKRQKEEETATRIDNRKKNHQSENTRMKHEKEHYVQQKEKQKTEKERGRLFQR
jgi:hypothetical protein